MARIAQVVERRTTSREVVGSISGFGSGVVCGKMSCICSSEEMGSSLQNTG